MDTPPAIDIRGGRCVRLVQGDYDRETVFADDPAAAALRWRDAGATRLHVGDLDGAREGRATNAASVERILAAVDTAVEVGGGIRDLETVQRYVNAGVERVVLGTAPGLVRQVAEMGVTRVIYTDTVRDGTLTEPNFAALEVIVSYIRISATKLKIIYAGGVSSIDHLRRLAGTGVEGAIVGRALYTGDIDLREALGTIEGA